MGGLADRGLCLGEKMLQTVHHQKLENNMCPVFITSGGRNLGLRQSYRYFGSRFDEAIGPMAKSIVPQK